MVKIRLKRMGRKKRPFYRIVVADSRSPRDGRNIEEIGYYNPLMDPPDVRLDLNRVDYWIGNGAKPTDTVGKIIKFQREAQSNQVDEAAEEANVAQEDINDGTIATEPEEASYDLENEVEELQTEGE